MSGNRQPSHDPLEVAIRAFQSMSVPARPPDEQVRARLGTARGDSVRLVSIPRPSKRRDLMRLLVSATVVAVLLLGGLALILLDNAPPESVQVAAPVSSGTARHVAVQSPPTNKESLMEGSLEQSVAGAQVILVATALDSAPAPPRRPGDLPESLIRFQVKRVLKGKLADKVISTRTPTAAAEFIGKEWVIMLSPEYMAGKNSYANCLTIKVEPSVKAILSQDIR